MLQIAVGCPEQLVNEIKLFVFSNLFYIVNFNYAKVFNNSLSLSLYLPTNCGASLVRRTLISFSFCRCRCCGRLYYTDRRGKSCSAKNISDRLDNWMLVMSESEFSKEKCLEETCKLSEESSKLVQTKSIHGSPGLIVYTTEGLDEFEAKQSTESIHDYHHHQSTCCEVYHQHYLDHHQPLVPYSFHYEVQSSDHLINYKQSDEATLVQFKTDNDQTDWPNYSIDLSTSYNSEEQDRPYPSSEVAQLTFNYSQATAPSSMVPDRPDMPLIYSGSSCVHPFSIPFMSRSFRCENGLVRSRGGTSLTKEEQRMNACRRERIRMRAMNLAFDALRTKLPFIKPRGRKFSKIEALRAAILYISYLKEQLNGIEKSGYSPVSSNPGILGWISDGSCRVVQLNNHGSDNKEVSLRSHETSDDQIEQFNSNGSDSNYYQQQT